MDKEKAKQRFLLSAEQGNRFAKGMMNYYGWNVEINYSKAFELFSEILKEDESFKNDETQYCLYFVAHSYFEGKGVEKDVNKAIELLRKAVELDEPLSINYLGYQYDMGKMVEKDLNKALELYKKSADLGLSTAFNNLAFCYRDGEGVVKDVNKAMRLFKRASNLGHENAKMELDKLLKEEKK